MPFSLAVNYRDVSRGAAGLRAAAGELVNTGALIKAGMIILVRNLQAEAPRRTGKGAASIAAKGKGIYALAYMLYQAEGTKPHLIVPVRAKALRFVVKGGAVVFAKKVNHPGNPANLYRERAIRRSEPELRVLMLENGRRLTRIAQEHT